MITAGVEAIAALVYGAGSAYENCTYTYTLGHQNAAKQQAYLHRLRLLLYPPEPGIYWERTGGKTHRLTIVRTP